MEYSLDPLHRLRQLCLLGLREGATESEINKAFRIISLACHPDMKGGDIELFQALVNARDTLISEIDARAQDNIDPPKDLSSVTKQDLIKHVFNEKDHLSGTGIRKNMVKSRRFVIGSRPTISTLIDLSLIKLVSNEDNGGAGIHLYELVP